MRRSATGISFSESSCPSRARLPAPKCAKRRLRPSVDAPARSTRLEGAAKARVLPECRTRTARRRSCGALPRRRFFRGLRLGVEPRFDVIDDRAYRQPGFPRLVSWQIFAGKLDEIRPLEESWQLCLDAVVRLHCP